MTILFLSKKTNWWRSKNDEGPTILYGNPQAGRSLQVRCRTDRTVQAAHRARICQKSRRPPRGRVRERQRIACVHISPVANKSSPPVGLCGGTRSLGQFISCFRLSYTFLSPSLPLYPLITRPLFLSLSLYTHIYIYIFLTCFYTTNPFFSLYI